MLRRRPYSRRYAPKTTKSTVYKKTTFKPRKKYIKSSISRRLPSGMPETFLTHLNYSTNWNLSSAAGLMSLYQFNLNSIYDPDKTAVGHQPLWHDLFTSIYENYRVLGCKIEAKMISRGKCVNVVFDPTDETATYSSMNLVNEQKNTRQLLIAGTNPVIYRKYYPINKVLSVPMRNYMTDDVYNVTNGGNPLQNAILNVYCRALNGLDTTDIDIEMKLTYTVKFTDTIQQGSS